MIITVKNLGVIKKAEFDTSKKLTVFCGPNSTGKTYLSYVIFDIFLYSEIYTLKSYVDVKTALNTGERIIMKKEYIDEYLSKMSNSCKKRIGLVFGVAEDKENDFFKNISIELSLSDKEYNEIIKVCNFININDCITDGVNDFDPTWKNILLNKKTNYLIDNNKIINSQKDHFEYQRSSVDEKLKDSTYIVWNSFLRNQILDSVGVYMLPVERNSIYTFKTELSLNRNILLDAILEGKTTLSDLDIIFDKNSRRYPLVVKNELRIANDLTTIQKRKSALYDFASEIEEKLLHGSIDVNQNGEVEYIVKDGVSLPIGISSSIVKTLSSLIIALKYQVNNGNLLIIDEPEMNLHPNNQVVLAEVLAKISKNVRLIVSTHSDYIIRELNNLIVAKSLKENGNNTYEQFYDYNSLLDYEDVQVLYFDLDKNGKVSVKPIDVDKYGFAVDSMDETINKQNERMQILFGQMDD
ncbi:MAG: AAA family ATPase [Bacteroidales bacterium]|nr:AAA family ATPase [Bacteroidales bacterium]